MVYDENFQFQIGVSVNTYSTKDEAKLCLSSKGAKSANLEKMAFKNHQTVTLDDFATLATDGHAFCNIFKYDANRKYRRENTNPKVKVRYVKEFPEYHHGKNKGAMKLQFKCDDFFDGAQGVFTDIDYTRFKTLDEYVNALEFKPSFSYCTYSDKLKGTRKFRLFYVFDTILDEVQFHRVSNAISEMVERSTGEEMLDDCGTRPSQYFNGTTNKEEIYKGYWVYSVSDFLGEASTQSTTYYEGLEKSDSPENETPTVDLNFVSDMERLDYDEFMHVYSKRYKYYWRVDNGNWINGKVQFVDDDYFALFYNVDKLEDGMCRRKKLFQRMCLRRIINPDATPNEILFNAYVDLCKFVDNTVDTITIDCLARNVRSCFRFTVEEIADKYKYQIATAKEKTAPKNGRIYNGKQSIKEGNYGIIDTYFDKTKSVKENLEILKQNGVKIGRQTLYNYVKERKINVKPTNEELYEMMDASLSVRENVKNLLECYGIKVSIGKVQKILQGHRQSTTYYEDLEKMNTPNENDIFSVFNAPIYYNPYEEEAERQRMEEFKDNLNESIFNTDTKNYVRDEMEMIQARLNLIIGGNLEYL